MKVTISKSNNNIGPLQVISSKSLGHRSIIAASLANGKSIISNFNNSKDMEATIKAMRTLGATIDIFENKLEIIGITDFFHIKSNVIDCNESGSTIRFLIPIFSLCNQEIKFVGSKRLLERPQTVYEDIYSNQNLIFESNTDFILTNGRLKPGNYKVKGNISSQFITGLLYTLPLLDGDSIIQIENDFESKSYVDLTISVLNDFGIKVEFMDDNTLSIPGNQVYKPCDYTIETDFSQLAFFAVLGAINSDLMLENVNKDSKQGDRVIIDILKDFNVDIESYENEYCFKKSNVNATTVDLKDCPDLGPILMVLACIGKGNSHFINASRLRIKESDRIAAMECELRKLNVNIKSSYDQIWIEESEIKVLDNQLNSHNDHRIVMALTVLASIIEENLFIDGAEAISKSYPNFFKDISSIGIEVEINE